MTLHLTKWFGLQISRAIGSDDRAYLHGVIWYPRSKTRLGYLYPSLPVAEAVLVGANFVVMVAGIAATVAVHW